MRYTTMAMLAGLLLPPAFPAAEQSKEEKSSASAEQLQKLKQELQKTQEKFYQDYEKAKSDKERQELRGEKDKRIHVLARRALDLARKHAEDKVAVEALSWIIGGGLGYQAAGAEIETAFDLLRTDHVASDQLQWVCGIAFICDSVSTKPEKFLRAVIEKNHHKPTRAEACYTLARLLRRRAILAERLRDSAVAKRLEQFMNADVFERLKASDPHKLLHEAEKLLERVLAEYSDVKSSRGTLGEMAKAMLFEMQHLVVGKVAPNIEGEDLNGKHFKLSDYRGKVVVLVFWANWCGPCRSMYPHERSLVKRLENKPFALLGINSDSDKAKLKEILKKAEITWRSWWDGGNTSGPIARKWNVTGWPTVYVLDAKGVIRHKNDVHGEKLDEAIDALLKEMENGSDRKATDKKES